MDSLKKVEECMVNFGLSIREAKVYTTLFQKKDLTASEIQKLVDIPRTKVYEVLHKLMGRGMCAEKRIGRKKTYKATNPASVFDRLLKDLHYKEDIAINALNILSPLFEQVKEKDNPLDYIEIIRNSQEIHERYVSNIELINHELLAFSKAPYSVPYIVDHDKEIKALKRGVKFRSIYEFQDVAKQELVEIIEIWVAAGEEARVTKELPMKMIIFDDKITMLALDDPILLKPSLTTMTINHIGFAKAQKNMFESYWEQAIPYHEFIKNEDLDSK